MNRSPQEMLKLMARIAEANRKAVAKALGKKEETTNPYVQYAKPTKS